VYNAGMVAAAALGAVLLPESGLAWWPLIAFACLYAAAAMLVGRAWSAAARLDEERPLG
jgi:hypothetical protein